MSLADGTMTVQNLSEALQTISAHPRGGDLARLVRDSLLETARTAGRDPASVAGRLARERGISHDDAAIGGANALDALGSASSDRTSAVWAGALLAHGIALEPPVGVDAEDQLAGQLAWIAANTPVDALGVLDAALGERAEGLWGALADLVQRHDARGNGSRAEAIVAAAALADSAHPGAQRRASELAASVSPPLARILSGKGGHSLAASPSLHGELVRAPQGPLTTFLLAACGWLLLRNVGRLVGRIALRYRRPAEIRLTPRGVEIRSSTRLLGKVLRERETLIPLEGLARATREVRYPRMGMYAGLIALALGSYLGVSWFIDGVRAASVSLVAVGLLVLLFGVGVDFVLATVLPGSKGRCRVLFVPRKGGAVCVSGLEIKAADEAMSALSKR